MKWILIVAMLAAIPVLARFLASSKAGLRYAAFFMGYLPFGITQMDLAASPISWAGAWLGYVTGIDLTLLDSLALAIVLSGTIKGVKVPLKTGMFCYFGATLVSLPFALVLEPAIFYYWQLLRVFLIFVAATLICSDPQRFKLVFYGLVVGLAIQTISAMNQKLAGVPRPKGFFGHPNQVGFMIYMILLPSFAMVLANQRIKWAWAAVIFSATCIVFTVSRASLAFALLGLLVVFILSAAVRWTPHKAKTVMVAALALAIATPFASGPISTRLKSTTLVDGEREAFKRAAMSIIDAYPMGVGGNNYVNIANTGGYNARAGVSWGSGALRQPPHQTYLLHWAEFSLIGLIGFVVMLLQMAYVPLATAMKFRRDSRAEFMVGTSAAVMMMGLHCFYEYMFMNFINQYFIVVGLGMMAGMRHILMSGAPSAQAAPRPAARSAITIMR